jgi:hypothetical protein
VFLESWNWLKAAHAVTLVAIICSSYVQELYLSHKDNVARFPTAAAYAREAQVWAQAVRDEFPRAIVAVVAAYSEHVGGDARRTTWNEELYAALSNSAVNGLILHIYQGSSFGSCSPEPQYNRPHGSEGSWGNASEQQQQFSMFTARNGVDTMLAVPKRVMANITDAHTAPSHLKIIVTEFNLFDRCASVVSTSSRAVYTLNCCCCSVWTLRW